MMLPSRRCAAPLGAAFALTALAVPAAAPAGAATISIDRSVTCNDGLRAPNNTMQVGAIVTLQATVPAAVTPGASVAVNVTSASLRLTAPPPPPFVPMPGSYPDRVRGAVTALELSATGTSATTLPVASGTQFGPASLAYGGYSGIGPLTSSGGDAPSFASTTAGPTGAPVVLRFKRLEIVTSETVSTAPDRAPESRTIRCVAAPGETPLAVIPSTGPIPAPPAITTVTPSTGEGNAALTPVTIRGSGFTTARHVAFRPVGVAGYETPYAADMVVVDDNTITLTAPAAWNEQARVVVMGDFGESADTPADDFTYLDTPLAPTASAVSPSSATAGETVVVTGDKLHAITSAKVGGVAADFTLVDINTVRVTIPQGAPVGDTELSLSSQFGTATVAVRVLATVRPGPTSVSPSTVSSALGGFIRVTGTGLGTTRYVLFGSLSVIPLAVQSTTTVWVYAPPMPPGTYRVRTRTISGSVLPASTAGPTITYR